MASHLTSSPGGRPNMSRAALAEFARQFSEAAEEYYMRVAREQAQGQDETDYGDDMRDRVRGGAFVRNVEHGDILEDIDEEDAIESDGFGIYFDDSEDEFEQAYDDVEESDNEIDAASVDPSDVGVAIGEEIKHAAVEACSREWCDDEWYIDHEGHEGSENVFTVNKTVASGPMSDRHHDSQGKSDREEEKASGDGDEHRHENVSVLPPFQPALSVVDSIDAETLAADMPPEAMVGAAGRALRRLRRGPAPSCK